MASDADDIAHDAIFRLFGVFLAQFYYYFTHYENDGVQLRSFVGVIGYANLY